MSRMVAAASTYLRSSMGPGVFRLASASVLVLVLLSATASADYLQYGVDAARTGWAQTSGPATDDVAFSVQLPGSRGIFSSPVVVGRHAFVVFADEGYGPGLVESGVARIDLDAGTFDVIVTLDRPPHRDDGIVLSPTMASDGQRLFVSHATGLAAYPLAGGEPLWSTAYPSVVADPAGTLCVDPAVAGSFLYLACTQVSQDRTDETNNFTAPVGVFAMALDSATGEAAWIWVRDASMEAVAESSPDGGICALGVSSATCTADRLDVTWGLSVIGTRVFVVTGEFLWTLATASTPTGLFADTPRRPEDVMPRTLWALSAGDGTLQWHERTDPARSGTNEPSYFSFMPTGSENHLFTELNILRAINPAAHEDLWTDPDLGNEDPSRGEAAGGSLVLAGDSLYVTSVSSLYRYDDATGGHTKKFLGSLDPSGQEYWGSYGLVATNASLYGRTIVTDSSGGLFWQTVTAVAADDGRALWSRPYDSPGLAFVRFLDFAVSGNLVIIVDQLGRVDVIGQTAASLRTQLIASSVYPAPGDVVSVDLSGTEPGSNGSATGFRADWGDGSGWSEWQPDPLLTHSFSAEGDPVARFQARNAAGQTASTLATFHVGGTAPQDPTLIESWFSSKHQETTFFVLGLLVTALAALWGLLARRRREGRLARELAAVQEAYGRTRSDPIQCEALLRERKARAQGLLADGKLTETQFPVLAQRIDDLAREVRLGELDERFQFLPMGMVQTLRSMLADGRIARWERDHFLSALAKDEILTPGQKTKVRSLIDGWFHRDGKPRE